MECDENSLARTKEVKESGISTIIGSGKETSINALAKLVQMLSENKAILVHTRTRAFYIKRRRADISKAKERLGYEPKVGLKKWIKGYMELFHS